MKREKRHIETIQPNGYGSMVHAEADVEDITAETVGDVLDLLAPYSREASVFMIPPKQGDNIQQVQVFDCRDEGLYKPIFFTIGGHGPHDLLECHKNQKERENNKKQKQIVLTEEQMSDVEEKFFEYDCFAIEDNVFMIDRHISVQTILDAADYIRTLNNH